MHCLLVLVLLSIAQSVFTEDCNSELCNPDETCCPNGIPGEYSCCPLKNAVCCEDHTCCPHGTQCDIMSGTCIPKVRAQSKLLDLDKLEKRQGVNDEEVLSDDGKTDECETGETCCSSSTPGECNCCPYSNAVCCEGHSFCCPENYGCDFIEGVCIPKETVTRMEKRQGFFEEGNLEKQCGDGNTCPSDTTCCTVAGGKFGCCPHLDATCCSDKIHCCPHDQVCDVTSHYCIKKEKVHQSTAKESALPIDFEDLE